MREHCDRLKTEIRNRKYIVTAVRDLNREVLIVDRKKVIVMYQNLFSKNVGGGIGPCGDQNMAGDYANEYEKIEEENQAYRLTISSDNALKSIDEWISLFLNSKEGAHQADTSGKGTLEKKSARAKSFVTN